MARSGSLGAAVRAFRSRAGLTQRKLADLAGMSIATLRDIEQERVSQPRLSTVRRVADALQLSAAEREGLVALAAKGGASDSSLWFGVLGPLLVHVGGIPVEIGSPRRKVLTAVLALAGANVVSRDALIEAMWGEAPPPNALELLHTDASRLRRRLVSAGAQSDILVAAGSGYRLAVDDDGVDTHIFRERVQRAARARRQGQPEDACELYAAAHSLWRGDVLSDLVADAPALAGHPAVAELTRLRRTAILDYASAAAEAGRHADVIDHLSQVAKADPLDEQVHAALVLALAAAGRQSAAMRVLDQVRTRLVDELGADPGPELTQARQRIELGTATLSDAPAVSTYRQLPPDIGDFTGREAEVTSLLRQAQDAIGGTAMVISAIEGMGGVGKTALAVHVAHRLRADGRCADAQLYVDLRAHADDAPADPGAVLASFLRLLNVSAPQIPQDIAARAALFRDRLYDLDAVVVLDNAASEQQVIPLLPAGPANVVLVTSRRVLALDGARSLTLDVFSPDEAEELLARCVGTKRIATERNAVADVVELCGRLPIAVSLVGRRMQARPQWLFAELASRLRAAGRRLGELAAGSARLRAVFDLSLQALDATAARIFLLIGLHPGPEISRDAVASLADTDLATARAVLDHLVDEHLLSAVSPDRYRIHDLLHEYARETVRDQFDYVERDAAIARYLDYYLHATHRAADWLQPQRWRIDPNGEPPRHLPVLTSRTDATRWLIKERSCLIAAVAVAVERGYPGHAWKLAHELRVFLGLQGYTEDWVRTNEAGLHAATQQGDRVGEAVMRTYLGAAYLHQAQSVRAESELHKALRLHRQSGDEDLQMITLNWLDYLCFRVGRFTEALRHNEQAIALCPPGEPYREGILRNNGGDLLALLGRFDDALTSYHAALALSRAAGNPDNESLVLTNIGEIHRQLSLLDDALGYVQQGLAIAIDNDLPPKEAFARHRLGAIYRDLGRYEDAVVSLHEALRIVREVSSSATESEVLLELGETQRRIGDVAQAEDSIRRALALAMENHERYHEARALNALAELYVDMGDTRRARSRWREALELFDDMATPDADRIRSRLHDIEQAAG